MANRAVFFDRDGVLNVDTGYTVAIDDFTWNEGAIDAIRRCNAAGWHVFVVTNQSGIARGYYDEAAVTRLHAWMNTDLERHGARIDDFRYCPHHPEGTRPEYAIACHCRKPAPGMIEDLAAAWHIDRAASLLVGDKASDCEAARAAGVPCLRVRTNEPLGEQLQPLYAALAEPRRQ